jgi:hypothetical protein
VYTVLYARRQQSSKYVGETTLLLDVKQRLSHTIVEEWLVDIEADFSSRPEFHSST